MKIDLKGMVALVTGGSRGIGQAVSLSLAQAGATVAINYTKDHTTAEKLIRSFRQKRLSGFLVSGDVGDYLEAEHVVHDVLDHTGRLDLVVNNAGIWMHNPIDSPRAEEIWDRTLRTNLKSAFNIITHAVPALSKSRNARVVNISSTAGQRGEAQHSDYAASKGGMIALTKSLAVELAPRHILVNCVAPGWVMTDMTIPVLRKPRFRRDVLKQIPLGKLAEPQDIANSVLFLVSPLASHITGEVINVNGGAVLCG